MRLVIGPKDSSLIVFDRIVNIPRPPGKRYPHLLMAILDPDVLHAHEVGLRTLIATLSMGTWCHLRSLRREAIIFVITLYSN